MVIVADFEGRLCETMCISAAYIFADCCSYLCVTYEDIPSYYRPQGVIFDHIPSLE